MSTRATARHTRPKKLTPKQNVQIFREEQVETVLDVDTGRGQVETGVDKAEESEYHLQQVIKASLAAKAAEKVKDAYIPTPPTIASNVQYDVLYPKGFRQPATYIRSSATVEDCQGIAYNMDEEDEVALKLINEKLPSGHAPCTEDQFEEVMTFFEDATAASQPYASIDRPPVQSLEELEQQYDEAIPQHVRTYAKLVYEHWYARRTSIGNLSIAPRLKFELGQESDDTDPYVCFRRRELRQPRKTRNRDAQSAEKLRRLRLELETARNLLLMVKTREQARKQALELDRQLFEQRQLFRDTKRKLGMKGDDELLVNQKKQKVAPAVDPNQAAIAQQLRMPMSGTPGSDLRTLEDVRAEKQRAIDLEIQNNIEKHIRWNEGFVDKTKTPLTPVVERDFVDSSAVFLEAMPAAYLPTPPASISEDEGQQDKPDVEMKTVNHRSRSSTPFRYASPLDDDGPAMPSFRRRVGRGGRVVIDRKMPIRSKAERMLDDRFKFDDSDDDEIDEAAEVNDDGVFARMAHRSYLLLSRGAQTHATSAAATVQAQQRAQIDAGAVGQSPAQRTLSQSPQVQQPAPLNSS